MIATFLIPVLFFLGALAWFFGTLVAGGAASVLLPIIILMFGSASAAPGIALASLMANPTRAFVFAKYINWKVIQYLLPGTVIGAALGAYGFTQLDGHYIKLLVGIFLISTIFQDKLENAGFKLISKAGWFFPLGLGVAFISGIVGAVGPVYNPFMMSYGLYKEQLVATKAFTSFVMQAIKLITYGFMGALSEEVLVIGVCLGLGGAVGVSYAVNHLLKMDTALFKKIMYIFMPILGAMFIYQSL